MKNSELAQSFERFNAPKFEGPQIMTRDAFEKESSSWLGKINAAQEALLKQIIAEAKQGRSTEALQLRDEQLEAWRKQVQDLMLDNAREGLNEPNGVMQVDQQLLRAMENPAKAMEAASFELDLEKSREALATGEQKQREKNLEMIRKAEAEHIERELAQLEKERAKLDSAENDLFKKGNFDAITRNTLDLQRAELDTQYGKFFDHLRDLSEKLLKTSIEA